MHAVFVSVLCDFALTRVLVSMKSSFFSCLKHSVCVCGGGGGGGGGVCSVLVYVIIKISLLN